MPFRREPGAVSLHRGWNLVGFGGAGAIEVVMEPLGDVYASLFVWEADEGDFLSYTPRLPFLSTLEEVEEGTGLWMFVDEPAGALWTQPAIEGAREVELVPGFNLVRFDILATVW